LQEQQQQKRCFRDYWARLLASIFTSCSSTQQKTTYSTNRLHSRYKEIRSTVEGSVDFFPVWKNFNATDA
jgi:hypothetical protein